MPYIDGFVIPVKKTKVAAYVKMAKLAAPIFKEHGAIQFRECCADDIKNNMGIPFGKLAKLKSGETCFFSYVVYASKAARDKANKKIMKDPRLAEMMSNMGGKTPFDMKRMTMGGFKVMVDE